MNKTKRPVVSLTHTAYAAIEKIRAMSGVPLSRVLEALVLAEYDAVMQGKPPLYPRPTTNEGDRE